MKAIGEIIEKETELLPGVAKPEPQTREQWLEKRRQGIGGSDAAVVLGLNPWKSPLALYCEKAGIVEPDQAESEAIEWGNILEPVVAEKYAVVTGRRIIDAGRFAVRRNPDREFMLATVDRDIPEAEGQDGPGVLEVKTAGIFRREEWQEEPPLQYQVQLQHNLVVTGRLWGSFAVLIGGQRFMWCDVIRNENFCRLLIEKEEEFWDRVRRGDPPPADGSVSSAEVLSRLYPKETGESVALPIEAFDWAAELEAVNATIKDCEGQKKALENKVKEAIGNAERGILPDGSGFTWKTVHRAAHHVEATSYRQLRRVKK